jgi:hypothetical protein
MWNDSHINNKINGYGLKGVVSLRLCHPPCMAI